MLFTICQKFPDSRLDWIPHLYMSNCDDPSVLSEETHGAGETDRRGFAVSAMTAKLRTQLCIVGFYVASLKFKLQNYRSY